MKQLNLPMPGLWAFFQCHWENGKQVRTYTDTVGASLTLYEGPESWVDKQNKPYTVTGPNWGTPSPKTDI